MPDAPRSAPLVATWHDGLAIVNLRGDPADASFRAAVERTLGSALPIAACSTSGNDTLRVVWVGPDDWFVIAASKPAGVLEHELREALAGTHFAVTDVSSGYTVLHLSGPPVLDVLAHGCPLDLDARVFPVDAAAGSHFFKASVWLWKTDEAPKFEVLVRRSFIGYVTLLLERCYAEAGFVMPTRA